MAKQYKKLIDPDVVSVISRDETLLGVSVGDMIGEDVEILSDGSVTGTLKYVTNFEQFNESNKPEQSGNYFPLKLTGEPGSKMTIKKNGRAATGKKDMDYDPEIILRVLDSQTVFAIEVDGSTVIELNFAKVILETE